MAAKRLSRRGFLVGGSMAVGAVSIAACTSNAAPQPPTPTQSWRPIQLTAPEPSSTATATTTPVPPVNRRVLRIAHLTDMHIVPQDRAIGGFTRALRHAQRQEPPPDILLNTGDCIKDSLSAQKEEALSQWKAFREVLEAECTLPTVHCIGNHDVWGWALDDPTIENDSLYGKGMALEQLELAARHFSFDQAGWHFIVLDSTHVPDPGNRDSPYTGKLDEEQFVWFEMDIQATPPHTPICVISHIPILAACEYFDGPNETTGNWVVPGAWMHIDARRMRSLFLEHPNVRLCLSGHTHQHERLHYLGVKYLTDGAVSANWWAGDYMDFPPAYVLVDLFADGTSEHKFIAYEEP